MRACLAGGVSVSASVCGVRAVRARAPSNVCALVRARGGGGWVGVVGGRRGAWRRGGGGGGWQGVKVGVGSWWGGGAADTEKREERGMEGGGGCVGEVGAKCSFRNETR